MNFKAIISVIVLLALGGGVWWFLTQNDISVDTITANATELQTAQVLTALNQLQQVSAKLDPTFFSDSVFMSLRDFTAMIPAEVPGRSNPFLPLSGAAPVAPRTTR